MSWFKDVDLQQRPRMATSNGKSVVVLKSKSAWQTWGAKRRRATPCTEIGFRKIARLPTVRPDIVFNADSSRLGVVGRKSLPATGGGHGILKNKEMKKMIIVNLWILSFLNTNLLFANNKRADAVDCGHAISSIMLSLNSLSEVDFCKYKSILNKDISLEDKKQQISSNANLAIVHNKISQQMEILKANEFSVKINEDDFKNQVILTYWEDLGADLTERQPPGGGSDPCRGYKIGLYSCSAELGICLAAVVSQCIPSGIFYPECAALLLTACAITNWLCVESVDSSYPGCVPKSIIKINPWIINIQDKSKSGSCE